jgi:hypothetical protein
MNVDERCFGVPHTPEIMALVRTVFERAFAHITAHVDHVRVRLFSVRDGIECRAMLRPHSGATLAITETRSSTLGALMASANGLARSLERRVLSHSRKSRQHHASGRRHAKLAA